MRETVLLIDPNRSDHVEREIIIRYKLTVVYQKSIRYWDLFQLEIQMSANGVSNGDRLSPNENAGQPNDISDLHKALK